MNVALRWAEIRRLAEIDQLSSRAIARHCCCPDTGDRGPGADATRSSPRATQLMPACWIRTGSRSRSCWPTSRPLGRAQNPRRDCSRGPQGYTGSAASYDRYLRYVRPALKVASTREVHYEACSGDAGRLGPNAHLACGWARLCCRLSVRGRAACYGRMLYIEVHPLAAQKPSSTGAWSTP